jgi:hypothetical protein
LVVTENIALRRALLAHLESREGVTAEAAAPDDPFAPGDIVIAPPDGVPLDRAAAVTEAGAALIVLAPLPSDAEKRRYLGAGAYAYLPMLVDRAALLDAVARACRDGCRR